MIKKCWSALYHLWYHVVVLISIIVMLPFIFLTSLKQDTYNNFFWWCRLWAKVVLIGMGFWRVVKRQAEIDPSKTYIIIGNHASELDIMMTLVMMKKSPFVFIGKAELAKAPLFGYFYKRTNILVDRKSIASKRAVLQKAAARLQDGVGVCLFPEGGIPDPKYLLAPFKGGAFKLAIEQQIPILPITYPDNKRHFGEFWDGGYPGKLRATIHPIIETTGLAEADIDELMNRCYSIIHDELVANGCNGESIFDKEKTSFAV